MGVGTQSQLTILRTLLRPAIRYCLRTAVGYQLLNEALKLEFLSTAEAATREAGEKVTISRLSVMTGLHRREVKRVTEAEERPEASPGFIRRLLGQWQHDPQFTTKQGKPRVLDYESAFRQLLATVSLDLNPAAVLSELERLGLEVDPVV